jgi:predicted Rossmann-fold nucleotide-binding protein
LPVNQSFPKEQRPNAWSTPALTFRFHYFGMRKMHLAMRANALVVFPGGFGTLDELFELLTLRQTDKAPRIPIVLVDRNYWQSVIQFERFVEYGMVDRADLELFGFAEDAEGIWTELLARPQAALEHRPGSGTSHSLSATNRVGKR